MASDAKIRANRANAQKSTGPRTAAGKERARLNATRHNLTGIPSLRSGPEKDAFDAYFERLIPDFDATTDVEFELAGRIVDVMFRLARISTLETNILAASESEAGARGATGAATADPLTDVDRAGTAQAINQASAFIRESRTFSNLSLYEQRLSRTLQKDLGTLQLLRNPKQQKGIIAPPRPTMIRWVSDDGPNPVETMPPVHLSAQPGTRPGVVRGPADSSEPGTRPGVVRGPADSSEPGTRPGVVRGWGDSVGFVISSSKPNPSPPGKAA